MNASGIAVGLAVVAVIAVAGFALSSGTAANVLGLSPRTDGQGSMWGQMGGGGMMHGSYQQGSSGSCPMDNDYDWNYSYGYAECPHTGENHSYGEPNAYCSMYERDNSYQYDYSREYGHCM